MSAQFKDQLDEALEEIRDVLEKAKMVAEIHEKLDGMITECDFAVKMSILNMAIAKAIIDESDDFNEAYGYVARISHTLVDVIDRHREKQEGEDDEEDEDNGPVH
jgi:hypothetical protein